MNIQELKEQVLAEASNLKKHATKEELSRLNFYGLNPDNASNCIYGQMTGGCFSRRAGCLIQNCTKSYYFSFESYSAETTRYTGTFGRNFSPIEVYISLENAQNEVLIDYLKGEKDSLTIKDL